MSRSGSLSAALAVIALLGAGCVAPTYTDATVLVLEYDLTPPPGNDAAASPGHHCGTASLHDDTLRVQKHDHDASNKTGRMLYIDPELTEPVATIGTNPFVMGFPAKVSAGISDGPGHWTVIDVDAKGIVKVDGTPVSLPYSWATHQDGWRMDAVLSEGPSRVQVIPDQMCM